MFFSCFHNISRRWFLSKPTRRVMYFKVDFCANSLSYDIINTIFGKLSGLSVFYARFFDNRKRRVWQGRINALEITFVNPYYFLFFSMIKIISSLKSHITSKIRNFPAKAQVLWILPLQGESKLKFLYEMSSHFRGELRQMGGKKKLGFYSISTINRY